jgi:hypothetical protein
LAGSFEGHWLSALHRFASVFSRPSALRLDLTFLLLSLFFFPFFFLFRCPRAAAWSSFFPDSFYVALLSKTFATRSFPGCDAANNVLYLYSGGNEWLLIREPILMLLTVEDSKVSALTTRMAFFALRVVHELGAWSDRVSSGPPAPTRGGIAGQRHSVVH